MRRKTRIKLVDYMAAGQAEGDGLAVRGQYSAAAPERERPLCFA
jgi:hypothetical protein